MASTMSTASMKMAAPAGAATRVASSSQSMSSTAALTPYLRTPQTSRRATTVVRAAASQDKKALPAQLLAALGAALIATSGVNPEAASAAWVPRPSVQEKIEAPTEAIKGARDVFGNLRDEAKSAASGLQDKAPSPSFSFPNPFASNPLDQAKDAAQSADRTAKDTAKSVIPNNPLQKAKKVAGISSNPLSGLGDNLQGNASSAQGAVKSAVNDVTGSGARNVLGQAVDKVQGNADQAKGEAKGFFSSNPFSGAANKLSGAAQDARSDARGAVADVTGANPLDSAKGSVSSVVDKLTGTLQKAQGDAKSKLPLGFAGLNEKVSGAAKEAGADVKDKVNDVTNSNPIEASKDVLNQAALKKSGSTKEAVAEGKSLFNSNPFAGIGDKISGAAENAAADARGLVGGATGNPADSAKSSIDTAADRVSGALKKGQGEIKAQGSKLPLGIAGLGDKVSGTAKQAEGQARNILGKATGQNPVAGGKNILGQAVDQSVGSAKKTVGNSKSVFSSNPLSGAGDKLSGAAQQSRGNARDILGKAIGANPVSAAKNTVASAANRATGTAQRASGDAKGALGGLNIRGSVGQVQKKAGNLADAVTPNGRNAEKFFQGKNL